MTVECSPRKGYLWVDVGERLVVKVPQTDRRRMNCCGAVNPLEGRLIQMTTGEAKASAFVRFLRRIIREYPRGRVWVYTDNLPVHKSEKVESFL
ncbi:MAG: transposase [Candidatus Jordarchaeum sp.]|uniref:transposase n=1 Tax=Candidatus Jordarchaeum sp. TaxID=2823881 RepID=UPI00404A1916